ncbi:MAG: hypothetical protein NTV15_03230 [Candidatus Bathyarchaeota archaeon]|nr:hypothetical protein [Candidatus Bathyarchaeota archaeon]
MFITKAATSPKIKDELKTMGFNEKQLPSWIGSKPIVTSDSVDNTILDNTTVDKTRIAPMKPAGNQFL